ncbi:MAG: pyridoxal phosphate-dependent aminotransferase [Microthrixaceae bacterium]
MTAPHPSRRASAIHAFEVMDVLRAAREREAAGLETLHLEVGQPAALAPRAVLDAAAAALGGPLGYTDALGLPELRERIALHYAQRYGIQLDPARVVVTSGASAGTVLALAALADAGDTVMVTEPGYPCYANDARVLGLEVVTAHLDASTGYRATPGVLQAAIRGMQATRVVAGVSAVIVASPANPTGTVLWSDDLDRLHTWCAGAGATLVLDEIYHGTSTEPLTSAAAYDDAVVIQSFSKYFAMTGWRLGWLVLPSSLIRPVEKLAQNLYLAPSTISQHAALAAFDATDELDGLASTYRANAATVTEMLRSHGITDIAPADGAFYVWANVGHLGDSRELCSRWLNEIGVAATPGHDFDSVRGSGFVRLSVAGDPAVVSEATARLDRWFAVQAPPMSQLTAAPSGSARR